MIEVVEIYEDKGVVCREILESLPEWFGIATAIDSYAQGVEEQPMLAGKDDRTGQIVGFLSLRFHTAYAVEAYVLGVRREWQRQGCGTALFNAATQLAQARGARFLTVKTLAATNPDPNYAKTRLFYERMGVLPIEVFQSLWGAGNPCLFMIKPL